ncbi:MAG: glycine oxidase ThiO [Planctomycetes bacterium]|nr:glycine oxidase ThiO [Planctomycetota bacterium]
MASESGRVAVIGGGVIGLSIAWRLAADGRRVTVYDAAPEAREASWAAAGMLAPHHEADSADDLWRLGVASLASWPAFSAALGGSAATDHHQHGGLVPLVEAGDHAAIASRQAMLLSQGIDAQWLDQPAVRALEPALSSVGGALLVPGGQVDPRRVVAALRQACAAAGVELRYHVAVSAVEPGLVADGAGTARFDEVILASGAWTPDLARLAGVELVGEPVKGQLIRFQVPDGLLTRFVHSHHAYLVPRRGQGVVVGSTMVSAGFDRSEDPAAIARLAAGARALVPALAEAGIAESWTGLRPRLQGGKPLIGRLAAGLLLATGHFRNGVLLAPITAEIITAAVAGREAPAAGVPFAPGTVTTRTR